MNQRPFWGMSLVFIPLRLYCVLKRLRTFRPRVSLPHLYSAPMFFLVNDRFLHSSQLIRPFLR